MSRILKTAANAVEANKAHYDATAVDYEAIPDVMAMGKHVGDAFKRIVRPNPQKTTVMEYACGTGIVSREIAPTAKSILGIDISQGMVDQYNKRRTDKMRAICAQHGIPLAQQIAGTQLADVRFDGIVCSMAYHHFADPASVTSTLAGLLAHGGKLVVVDRNAFEGDGMTKTGQAHATAQAQTSPAPSGGGRPHPHGGAPEAAPDNAVPHQNGFSEEQMREMFTKGGLVDVGFEKFKAMIFGNEVEMFAAHGTKPE